MKRRGRKGVKAKEIFGQSQRNLGSYCHDLKNPFTEMISVTPPSRFSPFKATAGLLSVM